MEKVQQFSVSKTGQQLDCEDATVVTSDYACVVDGATSQSKRKWDGKTGGQMAADAIVAAVCNLPPDTSPNEAVKRMTESIGSKYDQLNLYAEMKLKPVERASASVCVYSKHRRELWFVGDCQCLLVSPNGEVEAIVNSKAVDGVTSLARALHLQSELSRGKTVEFLRQFDSGRELIRPLLQRQRDFQNSTVPSEFNYWVIDGFPVSPAGIRVETVDFSRTAEIILATDGYPKLHPTLEQSESFLQEVIHMDPLLIDRFKGTKGVALGQVSFDDRSYLRIRLDH